MLTADQINATYKLAHSDAAKRYGRNIPSEVEREMSDRLRAGFASLIEPKSGMSFADHMRQYGLSEDILREFSVDPNAERKPKINDKEKHLKSWCVDNVGHQVTIEELAEISEFSESKCRTFITDNPNLFTKVKRGVWEIRDEAEERKRDKNVAG